HRCVRDRSAVCAGGVVFGDLSWSSARLRRRRAARWASNRQRPSALLLQAEGIRSPAGHRSDRARLLWSVRIALGWDPSRRPASKISEYRSACDLNTGSVLIVRLSVPRTLALCWYQ